VPGSRFILPPVKYFLPAVLLATTFLTSCTTLQNRRDMYSPQRVQGPYTRMLKDGIPKPQSVSGDAPQGSSDGKSVIR